MRSIDLRALVPATLLAAGLGLLLHAGPVAAVQAAAPAPITDGARNIYKTQCSLCHGTAGEGSQVGLALHVKDLRGKEVQGLSDDVIRENIVKGNAKGMPPFGDKVSKPDIEGLIALVRTFKQ